MAGNSTWIFTSTALVMLDGASFFPHIVPIVTTRFGGYEVVVCQEREFLTQLGVFFRCGSTMIYMLHIAPP